MFEMVFIETIGDCDMTEEVCAQHCGVKTELVNVKEDVVEIKSNCAATRNAIEIVNKTKTPLWAFILMIGMVISSLGLQWATYKSITELSMKMAVFESRIQTIERQTCDLPINNRR